MIYFILGKFPSRFRYVTNSCEERSRHALQLRQAKFSFTNVYLLVGVNSDQQVKEHKFSCVMSHAER